MTDPPAGRTDSGTRVIAASPDAIWRALTEPEAVAVWRPPEGMRARIIAFDARAGGGYRMGFAYTGDHAVPGKTSDHEDVFEGRFVDLIPGARMVERVVFDSADPAFAGEMVVTTTLTPVPGGTRVAIRCANVPPGIRAEDHSKGLASTLANLARFTEGRG